jgi:hypothetical protein
MEQVADRPLLNAVLIEAAKISPEERRVRITQCVAEGRHDPNTLPRCVAPSNQELVRYCDRCWSVIDPHGFTWSWPPQEPGDADEARAV